MVEAVGQKIRYGKEIGQAVSGDEPDIIRKIIPGGKEILSQLAPDDVRTMAPQPHQAPVVKGLHAEAALILLQLLAGDLRQLVVVAVHGLQLHNQGNLALNQVQHIGKGGNGFRGVSQMVLAQFLGGQILHPAGLTGGAVEQGVVDYRQVAVFGQVQVQLDAVAVFHGGPEGGQTVLRQTAVVEATVGVGPVLKLRPARVAAPAAGAQQIKQNQGDEYAQHREPPGFSGRCRKECFFRNRQRHRLGR